MKDTCFQKFDNCDSGAIYCQILKFYLFNIFFVLTKNDHRFSSVWIFTQIWLQLETQYLKQTSRIFCFSFSRDQSTHMSILSHMSIGCERVICGRHYPVQDQLNPCCSFETRLPTLLIVDFWILYKFYPINFRYCFLQSKFLLYNFPTFLSF